jgi:DNA-binding transcriptional regulator LsrR (DeoR family)
VNERTQSPLQKRLDLAARAAWLYYVRSRTQDEIASELNVSRQNVQRLVALANAEGLIKFRLDHPLAACIELAQRLIDRFGLRYCEVTPSARGEDDNRVSVGLSVARYIETLMTQKTPVTLALGTGRSLREAVRQVPSMDQPQHKISSLVGNVTRDGRASPYDVVMRLADKVGAQCYPLPMPIIANSPEERAMLQAQRGYQAVAALAREAKAWIVGVAGIDWNAPLHADGFIDDRELGDMMEAGAVGEVMGWTYDRDGRPVFTELHERLTAIRLTIPAEQTIILAGAGAAKVPAVLGALKGRIANGVVTDEATATAVLQAADEANGGG